MTAHDEAVERLARAMFEGTGMTSYCSWEVNAKSNREEWRNLARVCLREHPAVEALQECYDVLLLVGTSSEDFKKEAAARHHARTILAAIKEK